ncbi:hypothetical protein ACSBQ0_17290 [Bacillus altitudinis]|uniref:hypothetical protein n=1 Tax=Bacillus TaxID=1386 RepID=UPI002103B1A0|nr:hypothetical protein [Bacillus sp. FS02]
MGCSKKELIFGGDKEREDTVKLIILSIIMNGATYNNKKSGKEEFIYPLIDLRITQKDCDEVYNELKKRKPLDKAKKDAEELIERNLEEFRRLSVYFEGFLELLFKDINTIEEESKRWFEINYPFFANIKHFKGIQYLMNEADQELEYQSNLFIKLLIGNNRFAQLFMEGLTKRGHNQITVPDFILKKDKINIDDFISNAGQFGGLAVDFKNAGFTVFVKSFTEMWERNSAILMGYFNKKIFNIDLGNQNFKNLDDEFFHDIITSDELSKILYDIIEMEKYDMETMKGHNAFELYLQAIIIKNEVGLEKLLVNNLFKYVTNMLEIHNKYKK